MAKKKAQTNVSYEENIWSKSVLVRLDTGRRTTHHPYEPIVTLYDISLDDDRFLYCLKRYEGDRIANWQPRSTAVLDLGEEVVAEAEQLCRKLKAKYEAAITKGHGTWQYKMLEKFAGKWGWPKAYQDDLVRSDAAVLYLYNPQEWVGIIRESGTDLYCKDQGDSLDWRRAQAKTYGDGAHYYHATKNGVKEILAEQYARFVFK